MKYRFRVSRKKIVSDHTPKPPARRRQLRLKGAETLHKLSRLPEPVEEILFEFEDIKESRKQKKRVGKDRKKQLLSFLRACKTAGAAGASLIFHKTRQLLRRLRRPKKAKTVHALPILSGALCASLLVVTLSAGGILLGLFSGYGRSYRSVTVPNFVGKDPSSVLTDEESHLDLIIQYEKNDLVPEGLVISQSPHAGVRRRLYHQKDFCTVVLTVSRAEEKYSLEELTGKNRRDAVLTLRNAGILPKLREEHSNTVPKGEVIGTLPATGATLKAGDAVILRISLGKEILLRAVPSLVGVTEARADALLRAASLRIGIVSYQTSSRPVGTVIAQSVRAGDRLADGSEVSFTVSVGDRYALRTVPDLYGATLAEAEAKLREYGLVIGNIYPVGGTASRGTVMTQSPLPGAPITSSTVTVDLFVIS